MHRWVLSFPPPNCCSSQEESPAFSSPCSLSLSLSFPGGIHENMAAHASERAGSAACMCMQKAVQRRFWAHGSGQPALSREQLITTTCRCCSLYYHKFQSSLCCRQEGVEWPEGGKKNNFREYQYIGIRCSSLPGKRGEVTRTAELL